VDYCPRTATVRQLRRYGSPGQTPRGRSWPEVTRAISASGHHHLSRAHVHSSLVGLRNLGSRTPRPGAPISPFLDTNLTTGRDHSAAPSPFRLRQNPRTAPTSPAVLSWPGGPSEWSSPPQSRAPTHRLTCPDGADTQRPAPYGLGIGAGARENARPTHRRESGALIHFHCWGGPELSTRSGGGFRPLLLATLPLRAACLKLSAGPPAKLPGTPSRAYRLKQITSPSPQDLLPDPSLGSN
jgi:hypothetical protein